jgi:hypothetical protein
MCISCLWNEASVVHLICIVSTCGYIVLNFIWFWGTRWRSGWGTALQTGRSRVRFPMVCLDLFNWHNPPSRILALGLTQPLSEMSTVPGVFPGGKGGRCVRMPTLPHSCDDCLKICEPQPPGTLRACQGLLWDCFVFIWFSSKLLVCMS